MENAILRILENAQKRFGNWIAKYKAWQGVRGVNGLTERNLTMQVATAFLAEHPGGMAFMEVPFASALKGREDKHLDAYLFSDSLALLVESKIVWAPDHVNLVAADMDRMSPSLVEQLRSRHFGPLPAQTHGLVIAETWYPAIAEWWCGSDSARPRWKRAPLTADRPSGPWQFGSLKVYEAQPGTDGTLYWLYGISPVLTVPLRETC